jgi:hypothetical protein
MTEGYDVQKIAKELATEIGDSDIQTRVWTGSDIARVYVSRTLGHGRTQTIGYVQINWDGTVSTHADRQASAFGAWASAARKIAADYAPVEYDIEE